MLSLNTIYHCTSDYRLISDSSAAADFRMRSVRTLVVDTLRTALTKLDMDARLQVRGFESEG